MKKFSKSQKICYWKVTILPPRHVTKIIKNNHILFPPLFIKFMPDTFNVSKGKYTLTSPPNFAIRID